MAKAPVSRIDKFFDYLRRTEYASANVTEWLMGESPYGNLFKAAASGLTGKRRVDYMDLTDNIPLGLFLGFALDPLVWVPYGKIPKLVGATRVPKAIMAGHRGLQGTFPAYKGATRWARHMVQRGFTGGPLVDFRLDAGIDNAMDALRGLKTAQNTRAVPDAVIKGLDKGTMGWKEAVSKLGKMSPENLVVARDNMKTITRIRVLTDKYFDRKWMLTSQFTKRAEELRQSYKSLAGMGGRGDDLLEMMERALPVPVKVDKAWRWGLSDEFYGLAKKVGLPDNEMANILGRSVRPQVMGAADTALDAERILTAADALKGAKFIPGPESLPEYQQVAEAVLKRMHPSVRKVHDGLMRYYTDVTGELMKRGIITEEVVQGFRRNLGLNYVYHAGVKGNWQKTKEAAEKLTVLYRDKAEKAIAKLRADLKAANLPKDVVEARVGALAKVLQRDLDLAVSAKRGAEPMDALQKAATAFSRKHPEAAVAVRAFRKSVDELTEFRRMKSTIREINKLAGHEVFEGNLAEVLYRMEARTTLAVTNYDFLKRMIDLFPDVIKHADKVKGKEWKGYAKVADKMLGKYAVRREMEVPIKRLLGISTPGPKNEFMQFINWWDKHTNRWKYWTLIPFGKFHTRNLFSEELLNMVGGMTLPDMIRYNSKAMRLWSDARIKKIPKAMDEYHTYMRTGSIRGFIAAEAPERFTLRPKQVPWAAREAPGIGAPIRTGEKVIGTGLSGMERLGDFTEAVPRLAMHMWAKDKGAAWLARRGVRIAKDATPDQIQKAAASVVRKHHAIYDSFTPFEQRGMRRLMPFYSWTRFNLPLHVEMMVQNPKHYANLERARQAITKARGGETPDEWTPEYIREGYAIGWSKKPGKRTYLLMKNWLPHADISDILSLDKFKDRFLQMLHPIKVVPEVIWEYDTFRKQKLPRYPGEKRGVYGIDMPAKVAHLLSPIRVLQETNRLFFDRKDPFWERIVFHLYGRSYEIDVDRSKHWLKRDIGTQLTEIRRGMENAQKNGDTKLYRKLKEQHDKLERERERL